MSISENKIYVQDGFRLLFTKIPNLLGIKEAIHELNKNDIKNMIMIKYSMLSLEEIDYAFKLDRWSGDPVQHFQLFNAEYVSRVLERYKNWLQKTRFNNNLPIVKSVKKRELTSEEKETIVVTGVLNFFDEFKENRHIPPGRFYAYDYLFEKKLLPPHTPEFKEKIRRSAIKHLSKSETPDRKKRKDLKAALKEIQSGNKNQSRLKLKCKELVLKYYFNSLIARNRELLDELSQN